MLHSPEPTLDRRIALLIDGDNAQSSLIQNILVEAGGYGLITIRRIYGDWTTPNMKSWKDVLNTNAIQPVQQFRYTTGKNATDSALIIEAMDILYKGVVNGFCLVSSDSDYTRLATRIREEGIFVMGIGAKTTPTAFVQACEVFVYTENLTPSAFDSEQPTRPRAENPNHTASALVDPIPLLRKAFEMAVQDDGWALLGAIGTHLRQLDPGFDPRTFGHRQLSLLVREHSDVFDLKRVETREGASSLYVRLRVEGSTPGSSRL